MDIHGDHIALDGLPDAPEGMEAAHVGALIRLRAKRPKGCEPGVHKPAKITRRIGVSPDFVLRETRLYADVRFVVARVWKRHEGKVWHRASSKALPPSDPA